MIEVYKRIDFVICKTIINTYNWTALYQYYNIKYTHDSCNTFTCFILFSVGIRKCMCVYLVNTQGSLEIY